MNAIHKLDQYLAAFGQRLRLLALLKGGAALAAVLLVVSAAGAWFSAESGFADTTTNIFRVLLVLALAAVILLLLVDPLQKLKQQLSRSVERRVPDFDGRIDTFSQMKESNNPFLELLAEDALKVSERHPVDEEVRQKELGIAAAILAAILAIFLYLLIAGPGLLNYGMRNLLAGWAIPDLLPPQSIVVTPGDESVRRGSNVRITSTMEGFNPDEASIHIQNAAGEWQEVAMVQSPLGFEFTFFAMQQDLRYYVSSTGLRTPEYGISVVDVPGVQALEVTYNFPEWTSREPETRDDGDIDALPDTRIDLKVSTTAPLSEGLLVLNDQGQPLAVSGLDATGNFTVQEEGQYYIAAVVGGEQVRISDDYFIRLTEDGKPEIKLVRPGGDYNASSIEEVLTRVEAKDDYGLDSVALQYSVNGSPFESITLGADLRELTADHLFMLEEMTTLATRAVEPNVGQFQVQLSDEPAADGDSSGRRPPPTLGTTAGAATPAVDAAQQRIPLQPGDIISYYAEATDRSQTVRTDMFFIQVQPFNRRYSQSQLSGGGGGGGGGGPQDEISQRQRQIIVSTWNLIREQAEAENPTQVEINAKLLSELQTTLAEQAATLAERTRARQLAEDTQIEEFVNNMEQAVQRMHPASAKLGEVALNDAIQPAQEALQYLLRAESVFNDITVSQQQGGGGGGGGGASQDLAEMFELEMDLSLNQYETGNNASAQSEQQQAEDIMQQLDELAQRQEQLANNLRNQQQLTEAQRYQQEMLRREAERLQEQLDQLQRQQLSRNGQQQGQQQQGQQGQQGQEGQQGQQGQPGQPGQQGQGGQQGLAGQSGQPGQAGQQNGDPSTQQGEQIAQSELQRRMESAIRAMQQAQDAMQGNLSPDEMQRAAQEAQRQLEEARNQIAQDQVAGMQESFASMAARSEAMVREQERMARQLQQAMEKAVKERESGEDPNSRGMSLQEEWALAQEKQELAAELRALQQQMLDTMQNYGKQVPAAGDELQRANSELAESELEQAISDAALYIDAGYGLYIAGNESAVTNAMRRLADRLESANAEAQGAAAGGGSELDRARQQAQDLRAQLQQLAQGNQPGQQAQAGQGQPAQEGQPGQPGQSGQPGQEAQPGQAGGNQQANNNQPGSQQGGGRFGAGARGGAWNGTDDFYNGPIQLPDNFYDNVDSLTELAREAMARMELNSEELAQMYDLIRELEYTRVNRNDSILAQEYGQMLALIEQLEAGLQTGSSGSGKANVRTATSDQVPEEYQESVAEYFRRLSRD